MPTLVLPYPSFQPFTKILSSEVNANNTAITTLLNITKLDSTNVQQGGLSYDRIAVTTSNQVVVTSSAGVLTTTTTLPLANGGLGFSPTLTTLNIGQVVQVNQLGTALTLDTVPDASTGKIYAFYRFS